MVDRIAVLIAVFGIAVSVVGSSTALWIAPSDPEAGGMLSPSRSSSPSAG